MLKLKSLPEPVYILFLLIIITGSYLQKLQLPELKIGISRLAYLHYHIVEFSLPAGAEKVSGSGLSAVVSRNGSVVNTITGEMKTEFVFSREKGSWVARFPIPWGAKDGIYDVVFKRGDSEVGWPQVFFVTSRHPKPVFENPLKIITLESTKRLRSYKVRGPEGTVKDFTGLYDWMHFLGANTLWYMAGQTASYKRGDLKRDYPWLKDNLLTLEKFASETRKSGLSFGGWISCFRVFGNAALKPEWYRYSYKYRGSRDAVYQTEGISILDNERVEDIKDLVERLNGMDDVKYIGLDYIRPAGGGLDLVDDFVRAMDVKTPGEWSRYSRLERMAWLGRIVTRTTDREDPVIEKWNWWRAHRISKIIRYIRTEVDMKKPLWTFVLSWQLGHQHGQDPLMFQDAGADIIAVMMYEADAARFEYFIKEWRDYCSDRQINLVVGNQIDWPLHQYSVYPSGPEEFGRRIEKGIKELKPTGNLRGYFIHDFARALWGRKGPYPTMEWLIAGARGFYSLDENRYMDADFKLPDTVEAGAVSKCSLQLKNISDSVVKDISVEFPRTEGVEIGKRKFKIEKLSAGSDVEIPFTMNINAEPDLRMGRYMVAVRAESGSDTYLNYRGFWVRDMPADPGNKYR